MGLRSIRLMAVVALCACFGVGAFADNVTPPDLSGLSNVTTTRHHHPADPINVGLIASKDEIVALMKAAGWMQAVPVSFRSSAHIVGSVAFRRAYLAAPVSALYYLGRRQDLAFEKEVGVSASHRHHVRFWKVRDVAGGRSLWLGDATYDRSVGFSHRSGLVTHHISGDVDAERTFLMGELAKAQSTLTLITVPGQGARRARNGGGDLYWTDGNVVLGVLAP